MNNNFSLEMGPWASNRPYLFVILYYWGKTHKAPVRAELMTFFKFHTQLSEKDTNIF
jgi:hypothetical protein